MANNKERTMKAVVEQKLTTKKTYTAFEKKFGIPAYNTLPGWNALGFSVTKGEHAVIRVPLWTKFDSLTDEQKAKVKEQYIRVADDGTKMCTWFTKIFSIEQVHPTYADYSTKQAEMLATLKKPQK